MKCKNCSWHDTECDMCALDTEYKNVEIDRECRDFDHLEPTGEVQDYCEWEDSKPYKPYFVIKCNSIEIPTLISKSFKYCPYCGKPIKIKG